MYWPRVAQSWEGVLEQLPHPLSKTPTHNEYWKNKKWLSECKCTREEIVGLRNEHSRLMLPDGMKQSQFLDTCIDSVPFQCKSHCEIIVRRLYSTANNTLQLLLTWEENQYKGKCKWQVSCHRKCKLSGACSSLLRRWSEPWTLNLTIKVRSMAPSLPRSLSLSPPPVSAQTASAVQ